MPFIELNRMVEQQYGASVPLLIEMSGLATFRRHERTCLERVIAENERAVIATAGGIVSNPETYALLLRRTHTVWISAQPEEHMSRVMKQGDFRPMARNREAMADLVAILEAPHDAARLVFAPRERLELHFDEAVDERTRFQYAVRKRAAARLLEYIRLRRRGSVRLDCPLVRAASGHAGVPACRQQACFVIVEIDGLTHGSSRNCR